MAETPSFDETVRLPAAPPVHFARYRLKSELGRGGMGVVWCAEDTKLQRDVALKFLPDEVVRDREAMADLAAETRRCLALTHPHIVRVHDLVEDGGRAAISMELVDGPSLAARKLEEPHRCFTVAALRPWVAQLCAALDYAHTKARIVHRDLKPLNLLVNRDGDLKVVDFGIARSLRAGTGRLTLPHATSLSLGYAGPQQLLGEPAAVADDIYSLGATLYELLTGKPPFYEGDIALQVREVVAPPLAARRAALGVTGRGEIPAAWEKTISACLAKNPADRPASAAEVAARLGLTGTTGSAFVPASAPPARTSFVRLALAAAGLAAVAAAAWFFRPVAPARVAVPAPAPVAAAPLPAPQPAPIVPEFVVRVLPADVGARVWLAKETDRPVPDSGELRLAAVPVGENELTVQASGYRAARSKVEMSAAGGTTTVTLEPVHAAVEIVARPGTRVVAVDARGRERPVGIVPDTGPLRAPQALTVGTYRFRLTHPGFADTETPETTLVAARPTRLAPVQTPRPGELRVFSVPDGADVVVGGKKVGTTPATLSLPSDKAQVVEIALAGHRPDRRNVVLKPGETQTLDFGTLVAASGSLELQLGGKEFGLPRAAARVDGTVVQIRRGRIDGIDPGTRKVELSHPDYEPWQTTVVVRDRDVVAVPVTLVPKPAELTVTVTGPAAFTVTVDGKPAVLRRNLLAVPAGKPIRLEVSARGYRTVRRELNLAPRARETVAVTLEKIAVPEIGQPWTVPDLGLVLLPVAAGSFTMGSEAGNPEERPRTAVQLTKPFWLGRTEVTQAEWQALMDGNPSRDRGDNRPVENITWLEAVAYCRKLTERERAADRLPAGYVYALPTEAQWEYACRAGDNGDQPPPPAIAAQISPTQNSAGSSRPVATAAANAWGFHDLLGNVWEWCLDGYADKHKGGSVADPKGTGSGANANARVRRGGSYAIPPGLMRYAMRGKGDTDYRIHNLGFRVALVPGS